MSWKLLHIGPVGQRVLIGGVNVWERTWKTQGEGTVSVKHPAYPEQQCRLNRYFIEAAGKAHQFAAGEISPGVWLLFAPNKDLEHTFLLQLGGYLAGVAGCFILVHGFWHSPKYIALGSVLLALAIAAERYVKARRHAISEA